MTGLFQAHLQWELNIMVKEAEWREFKLSWDEVIQKKRHVSHESESSISVASTSRDSDDDSEFKEWSQTRSGARTWKNPSHL